MKTKNRHGRVGVRRPIAPSPAAATVTASEATRLRARIEHAIGGFEAIAAICGRSRAKDAKAIAAIVTETMANIA